MKCHRHIQCCDKGIYRAMVAHEIPNGLNSGHSKGFLFFSRRESEVWTRIAYEIPHIQNHDRLPKAT